MRAGLPKSFLTSFVSGATGQWSIDEMTSVVGNALDRGPRLRIVEREPVELTPLDAWVLCGTSSNTRYTHRAEASALKAMQPELGRPHAKLAALILIRKSDTWWSLSQDERREIFQEKSRHIDIGMRHLPAIARRLYHARDLGEDFDFLTWFEYAPEHRHDFERMVTLLRTTPEWTFVDREVDIRLHRIS